MGFLSKIFGKKPRVPDFVPVDIDKEQADAVQANINVTPKAGELSLAQQAADQDALMQGIRTVMPNYDEMLESEYDITRDLLTGKVPKDVADRIKNMRASYGIGMADSDFLKHSTVRDLGRTSLDMQQAGMGYLDNRIRRQSAFVANPMSVQSMFISPMQRVQQKMSERDSRFNRDYAANKIAAAPSPVAVGLTKVAMAAGGAYLGAGAGAAGAMKGAMAGASLGNMYLGGGGGGGGSNMMNSYANMMAMQGMFGGGGGGGGFGSGNQSGYSLSNGTISRATLSGMADDNL